MKQLRILNLTLLLTGLFSANTKAYMFFKANKTIPTQKRYMEGLNELGASWNETTSNERVNYFFTVPKDSVEPAMEFMYNAITGPLFK